MLSRLTLNPHAGSSSFGQVHHEASRTDDDDGIVLAPGSRTALNCAAIPCNVFSTGTECTATLGFGQLVHQVDAAVEKITAWVLPRIS